MVPGRWDDVGHIDPPPAEVTFGAHAKNKGAAPVWGGTTCGGVYCHGATIQGGVNKTPRWTAVQGKDVYGKGEVACGTCHSLPPTSAPHTPAMSLSGANSCGTCHGPVIDTSGAWVNGELHIDGIVEATGGACGSCHDLPPATGAHLKHAGLAKGVYSGLDTAASLTNPTGYAFGCAYCHPMDAAKHANGGTANVELYDPTAPAGSLKLKSPTAAYTPGGQTFADNKGRAYTLGTCANVYCHSGPSYATPNALADPGLVTAYPIAYPAYALNVGRDFKTAQWGGAPLPCSGCHGMPIRTAEPAVHAAAGQSHSVLDAVGKEVGHGFNHGFSPLTCRTCHNQTVTVANTVARSAGLSSYSDVPIASFAMHVNGNPDVAFDKVTPQQYRTAFTLTNATYNQATSTCSNVACHLNQTAVKNGNPFRPATVTAECNACHQY